MIELEDIYEDIDGHMFFLWMLLSERTSEQSISHRAMPTWKEHCAFVDSRPYLHWYSITNTGLETVGAIYLTRQREIGISIHTEDRGHGYATAAITELMRLHPGRFLANINPANEASIALFRKLGFGGPIQITLEKP